MEIEKLKLESMNVAEQQQHKLKELFPEVFTEGNKIDWDKLRLTLGEQIDVGKERFGMNWPGKTDCYKTIQQPSIATLVPYRDESLDFDTTQNLFIEGDNLEVLKLLQKSYLSKIKMIYIDPPYNTNNDFIYPDNYSESLQTYLEYTGQVDSEGRKFSTNTESDGRFHSKWLNMMYPRLFLAKNLLKEDGVIFISINDKEVHNLRAICNDLFGEENFLTQFVWRTDGNFDNQARVKVCHEYILTYCKNLLNFPLPPVIDPSISSDSKLFNTEIRNTIVKNGPKNPISEIVLPKGFPADFENGVIKQRNDSWPHVMSDATVKDYKLQNEVNVRSGWSSKDLAREFISNEFKQVKDTKGQLTSFVITQGGAIESIKERNDKKSHVISVLTKLGTTQSTSSYLSSFGISFDYPKPVQLIKYLIQMNEGDDFYVLDFFAGSGTLAEAVYDLNMNGGKRKYICVQLPHKIEEDSEFKNIAELSKERIRKVVSKIRKDNAESADMFKANIGEQDLGFKSLKLQSSNFNLWRTDVDKTSEAITKQLELNIAHVSPDATQEAILFELLLKSGFELTTPILKESIANKTVFSVAEGELLVCLEKELTQEVVKTIAEKKPSRVICLDEGFQNNDQLKTNAVQIMKSKGVVKFQTV
jgi:adenine-specific DNA-methyltransferase